MAGISSPGLGSGLDVSGLVSQLVAAERAPALQRITREEANVTTRISALGSLKGALASFAGSLNTLKDSAAFAVSKATSGDNDVFTVTADSKAAAGRYDVEVVRLAKAHQLASGPFVGGATSTVGHGTLTLSLGSSSFDVAIAEDASTLADVRDAINSSANNPGITATLINGVNGSQLVLTSNKTGASSAIEVAASGGNGGLSQLTYDPDGAMNLTELQPAQSALIRVSNIDIESEKNVIDQGIDGLKITLKKEQPGTPVALDVALDSGSMAAKVQKFVSDYNTLQTQFNRLRAYDPATQAKGPMLGDSLLRGIEAQVRRGITDVVSTATSEYTSLTSIGIKTTLTGTLEVDTAKLNAAIEADPDALASLFGSTNGVATRMHTMVEGFLSTTGDIQTRNDSLNKAMDRIGDDRAALDLRVAQIQQRYTKQFTALDGLLSQMQSTSSYLASQLGNLPKMG